MEDESVDSQPGAEASELVGDRGVDGVREHVGLVLWIPNGRLWVMWMFSLLKIGWMNVWDLQIRFRWLLTRACVGCMQGDE